MKLNNKGITLVEIIVSVVLISIVLLFLFTLLIQVNNENSDNEVRASYLVNQSTFISQIEEDFIDYKLSEGIKCSDDDISNLNLSRLYENNFQNMKCLTFTFYESNNAYLFLYKREENEEVPYKTILSYYRGDFRQSVELEDFDWTENEEDVSYDVSYNNGVTYKTYSLPIVGPDYNDYSINLSYAS